MSQITYNLFQGRLQAGDKDLAHPESPRAFKASADVRAGRGVVAGAAGAGGAGLVAEPSGVGRRFYGVASTDQSSAYQVANEMAFKLGYPVPVQMGGYVNVAVIGAVNPDNQVFMLLTGADAGKFSAGPAVAGSVCKINGATFESVTTAAGVAVIRLNPGEVQITA